MKGSRRCSAFDWWRKSRARQEFQTDGRGPGARLEAESREVNGDELETIHHQKTGALIRAAARCGAMIAGANEDGLAAITAYARNLGLMFQITDDLLDVTATAEDLGKTPGKDARSRKATFRRFMELMLRERSSREFTLQPQCSRTR